MTATEMIVRPQVSEEMSVEQMIAQTQKIQQCMKAVMKEGEHFGVIPGTKTKPTLLKPGAEKLCLMFRLDPQYEIMTAVETAERISFTVRCTLYHIPTGNRIASGLGSCNSREKKYMRAAPKKCPQCGKESIIKGQEQYGGGWICWKKKDGCGAKFDDAAEAIVNQPSGLEDPADLHNTILKMGCKRALVAAVLNGTAASDFFTQDLEDLTEKAAEYIPPQKEGNTGKGEGPSKTAATSPVQSAGATTSTNAIPAAARPGNTTTKKTVAGGALLANAVVAKQGDPMSVQAQWAHLGMIREEVPGKGGDHSHPAHPYAKDLGAYETWDGKRCTSARHLTFDQAANLIRRYSGLIARKADTFNAMEASTGPTHEEKPAEEAFHDELAQLRAEMAEKAAGDDSLETDVLYIYGIGSIAELHPKHVPGALALTLAWSTKSYTALRSKIMDQLVGQ